MLKIALIICFFSGSWIPAKDSPKTEKLQRILLKTQETYRTLQTLSAGQTILLGSPEPATDMLIGQITGRISLKKVTADTSLGWYFVNEFTIEDMEEGYRVYYAGDSLSYFNLKDSTWEKQGAGDAYTEWGFSGFDEWKKKVDLFYERLCLPDSVFEKQEGAWLIGELSLGRDTVIGGRACYVIENRKIGRRPELQVDFHNFEKLAIDKRDYLPVFHYKHFIRNVKGKPHIDQVNQVILSDWKLNKKIEDSIFRLQGEISVKKQEEVIELQIGDSVPDWKLKDINGDTLSLYTLKKERIILEFGYIGCGACALAIGEMKEQVLDVCDREKFLFLCIDPIDSFEMMRKYAEEMKITYPFLKGNAKIARQYGITGYPRIFVLDREYRIVKIFPGYFEGLGKAIQALIE